MSKGIASGVPPAGGGAGGAAGAGVCACARIGEVINTTAQAARVIETIGRIVSSQLSSGFEHRSQKPQTCSDYSPPRSALSLLCLEVGVMDHLVPALLLDPKITIARAGRAGTRNAPRADCKRVEVLGLHRHRGIRGE